MQQYSSSTPENYFYDKQPGMVKLDVRRNQSPSFAVTPAKSVRCAQKYITTPRGTFYHMQQYEKCVHVMTQLAARMLSSASVAC